MKICWKKNSNLLKIRQKYRVPYILLLPATEFIMEALLCNTQYSYIVVNSVTVTMLYVTRTLSISFLIQNASCKQEQSTYCTKIFYNHGIFNIVLLE